jgi:hypothetical protein
MLRGPGEGHQRPLSQPIGRVVGEPMAQDRAEPGPDVELEVHPEIHDFGDSSLEARAVGRGRPVGKFDCDPFGTHGNADGVAGPYSFSGEEGDVITAADPSRGETVYDLLDGDLEVVE